MSARAIDVVKIEDDINFVVGLLCQYGSLCTHMGTIAYEDEEYAYPGKLMCRKDMVV